MIRSARFGELDRIVLYQILGLRSAVFGVEQHCLYNDLDGRDHEPETLHVWREQDGDVVSALRLLTEPDDTRTIGRVVTAPQWRGRGLAASLIDHALTQVPADTALHLRAQSRLEPWYQQWGFRRSGPDVFEDGIRHVPMIRAGPETG